ncbi:MAG TPA: hypothetical protein VGE36_07610 [Roseateles sp.]
MNLLKLVTTFAALYHLLATVAAMMAVFHFARVLRGEEGGHLLWRRVFTWGETHLWISGAVLIAAGIAQSSLTEYLGNPKLWTKLSLVLVWAANSWAIKRTLRTASEARRNLMFGLSASSLLYGSFLGVAKPLAYGVLPFPWFLAGYAATVALCMLGARRILAPQGMAACRADH